MDKNTLTGFILIAAVLIGFSYFGRPSEAEIQQQRKQDSLETVQRQKAEEEIKAQEEAEILRKTAAATDSSSLFFAHRNGENQNIVLENELVKLTFGTRGGSIKEAVLKEYKNQEGGPVVLFDEKDAYMNFLFEGKQENINTRDFFFTPVHVSDSTVTMRLQTAEGATLDLNYALRPNSYMVDFTVSAQGLSNVFSPSLKTMAVEWFDRARQQEKGFDFENQYSTLTYKIKDEGTDYLNAGETGLERISAERLEAFRELMER